MTFLHRKSILTLLCVSLFPSLSHGAAFHEAERSGTQSSTDEYLGDVFSSLSISVPSTTSPTLPKYPLSDSMPSKTQLGLSVADLFEAVKDQKALTVIRLVKDGVSVKFQNTDVQIHCDAFSCIQRRFRYD